MYIRHMAYLYDKLFSLLLKIEINLQKLYYKFNIALASDSILTNESYLYNHSKAGIQPSLVRIPAFVDVLTSYL